MNKGLQIYKLTEIIKKQYKDSNIDPDDAIEQMKENFDSTLGLSENIWNLTKLGILEEKIPDAKTIEEMEQDEREKIKDAIKEVLTTRYFHCHQCDYTTRFKDEIIEHLAEEHGFEEVDLPPVDKYNMGYIILDELLRLARTKEFKGKKNFPVKNRYLWLKLLKRLSYEENDENAPSNQKPRKILDDLGLLGKIPSRRRNALDDLGLLGKIPSRRRNALGYDKNARRVYWISKKKLEDAIYESEFWDLIGNIDNNRLNPYY